MSTSSRLRVPIDPSINYYQVLDVQPGASDVEIKQAYRALMKTIHPDLVGDELQRGKAEERCKLVNGAYAVLGNPSARKEYDRLAATRVMNDVIMQRYTGNASPGRQPIRRTPPPQTIRATRKANERALIQLLIYVAGFALVVMIALAAFLLTSNLLSRII